MAIRNQPTRATLVGVEDVIYNTIVILIGVLHTTEHSHISALSQTYVLCVLCILHFYASESLRQDNQSRPCILSYLGQF